MLMWSVLGVQGRVVPGMQLLSSYANDWLDNLLQIPLNLGSASHLLRDQLLLTVTGT